MEANPSSHIYPEILVAIDAPSLRDCCSPQLTPPTSSKANFVAELARHTHLTGGQAGRDAATCEGGSQRQTNLDEKMPAGLHTLLALTLLCYPLAGLHLAVVHKQSNFLALSTALIRAHLASARDR